MAVNNRNSPSTDPANEETPLLHGQQHDDEPQNSEQAILPSPLTTTKLIITLSSVYVGVFFAALDTTIVATLSAPISTSFNSLSLLSWIATAYLISNAACQPLSGRLTDIFGRRTGLIVSNVLFASGNLICGLSTSPWTMILGRVIAGMGGGGLQTIATFVASDLVPLRRRGLVQGLGNICYGSGAALGGVFGGWVNDVWGWRIAFISQVPFVIISGILVCIFVSIPTKESERSRLSRVDFLGAAFIVNTLVLLLLGLNSGGNTVPWTHPLVLISLPLSLLSLAGFVYIEATPSLASEPVIPVRLLLHRTVAAACLTNWFITMVTYMVLFYMPIFFQVKGFSTTSSGISLVPQSVGTSIGSLGCGIIMNYTGKYKILSSIVLAILCISTGALATLTLNGVSWPAYVYQFFIGIGYAGALTITLLAVIAAVAHEHQAVVTSATYAFRSTGSTIGITIAGVVYQNVLISSLHNHFDGRPGAEEEIKRIRESLDELKHLPKGWETGVMVSFEAALRAVFLTAMGIALLAFISGAFMKEHVLWNSLDRKDNEAEENNES